MFEGSVKKFFPGGNTYEGFYSFYNYIIEEDATRIFILKGGPGVGKSTFMKKIGKIMLEQGFKVEYHYCSSDSKSLDAVVIPSIKVALIDGTSPHAIEPNIPGAVDEIIYLGDFWDKNKISIYKQEILEVNKRIKRLYRTAHSALKESKVIRDEWESYISEAINGEKINKAAADCLQALFNKTAPRDDRPAKVRHLFATAITSEGIITDYVESLLRDIQQLFSIGGEPGSGAPQILARIADKAIITGLHTEIYHSPFNPSDIDLVILPEIKTAAMYVYPPYTYDPSPMPDRALKKLNLSNYIDPKKISAYTHEINSAICRYQAALDRTVFYLRQAKFAHDYLESFYIPAMDFEAVNSKCQEILQQILKYAGENHYLFEASARELPK